MSGKAEEEDPDWVRLQAKAFQKWVNVYLGMRKMHITNLYKDLSSGVALINLLEVLGGEKVCRKYNKRPKMRIQKLENLGFAFKYLAKKGVQLLNLGPNDVADGNRKIILGLLWTIISKFQIADIKLDGVSGKDGLLLWYKRQVASYEVKVSNFSSSFKDGLAFCALLHKFRPSVVPWDELKAANDPHRALNTAFEVARDHLGVEPLMDAEDVADVRRPDEKIVTCYVSFLFQAIGALSKQDQLVGSIHKALEITRKHDSLIASYLEAASASREWVAATEAKYRGDVEGDTLAGVKACLDGFYKYRRAEKPVELAKLSALQNTLNTLHSSQRNNNRPPYVPPEGATVEELQVAWKALEQVEDSYEERIWLTYANFEVLEATLARFRAKSLQVEQWIDKQVAKFSSTDYGASVAEAETLIEEFKAFQEQRRTFLAVVTTLEGWATGDGMEAHRDHSAAIARIAELRAKIAAMDEAGAAYSGALAQSLEALQALVEQAKAYNAKSTAYLFAADELEEDIVNEPIPTTSMSAVQGMKDKFEAAVPARLAAVQALHEEVVGLAAALQEAGFQQAFARYTPDALTARLDKVQQAVGTRREALGAALAEEERKEALRGEFAQVAADFTDYCKRQQEQCATLSGSLDEQLAAVTALQGDFATVSTERHAAIQASAAKLAEAGVVTNQHTRENLDSLMARSEELHKYLAQSEEALQGQIIAARAGDVTVEQIKEWKEVFAYFDKDEDDNLNLSEFYSCATGIGLVMNEAEMKEAFDSIDTSGDGLVDFDEFTQFMVQRLKDPGFDRDDVQRAFNELAGPGCAGTMTDAQIRRFFGTLYPADADLLTATMPVATAADVDGDGSASVATSSSVGGTSSTGGGGARPTAGAGAAAAVEGGELTEVVVRNTVAFVDDLFTR